MRWYGRHRQVGIAADAAIARLTISRLTRCRRRARHIIFNPNTTTTDDQEVWAYEILNCRHHDTPSPVDVGDDRLAGRMNGEVLHLEASHLGRNTRRALVRRDRGSIPAQWRDS